MAAILYESYYGIMPLDSNIIEHSGTKGMKWYHRRYQNEDGSLTPAGREHYGVGPARDKAKTDKDGVSKKDLNRLSRADVDGDGAAVKATMSLIDKVRRKPSSEEDEFGTASKLITDLSLRNASKYDMAKAVTDTLERIGDDREINADDDRNLDRLARHAGFKNYAEADKYKRTQDKAEKAKSKIQAIIDSGDIQKIKKNASKLSTDQLRTAMEKAEIVSDIKRMSREERKERASAAIDKAFNILKTGRRVINYAKDWKFEYEQREANRQLAAATAANKLSIVKDEMAKRLERKDDKQYERDQKALERRDAIDKWKTERRDAIDKWNTERADRIAKEARERYDARIDKNTARKDAIDKWNAERKDKRDAADREQENKRDNIELEKYKNDRDLRLKKQETEGKLKEIKANSDAAIRLEREKQKNPAYTSGKPNNDDEKKKKK
jgi:hypothetical protein